MDDGSPRPPAGATRRPRPVPAGAGLSLTLRGAALGGAILGGTALAVAGAGGLLEGGPGGRGGAGPLAPGDLLRPPPAPREAPPPPSPAPRAPRLVGLDAGPGGAPASSAEAATDAATVTDLPASPTPPPLPTGSAGTDAAPGPGLERRVREQVAALLGGPGLAPAAGPLALSDAALEGVAAGQAAAGSTGGDAAAAGGAEADRDPGPGLDALNRVLVEKGGVLLPRWGLELQTELLYSYEGSNGLLIVERDGARSVMAHDADVDRLEAAATARLGLPWRSQAELRVPYLRVAESTSDGLGSDSRGGGGLGDVELALSRQLLSEDGYLPDLLAEARWRLPTGDDPFGGGGGPAAGSGFHGVGGRLTLLKTHDPVVFLGSLGYTANLEDEKGGFDIDPGDAWSLSAAAVLAAGPGVSLRAGFGMTFTGEAEVDGEEVAGSDRTEGVLSLGTGVTVAPGTLLDVGVGIGVTEDAPDVAARAALAYRF